MNETKVQRKKSLEQTDPKGVGFTSRFNLIKTGGEERHTFFDEAHEREYMYVNLPKR